MFKIDASSLPNCPLMTHDQSYEALIRECEAFRRKFGNPQRPHWPVQDFMVATPALVYRFAPYTEAIELANEHFGFQHSAEMPVLLARLISTSGNYGQAVDSITQLLQLHRRPEWKGNNWQLSALYRDASANDKARGDD